MDIHEFAQLLNGREMGYEITREEVQLAKEIGYVVVFGASDDLMEFRGAISDEADCYEGEVIYLEGGKLFETCEHDPYCNCPYIVEARSKCRTIEAIWARGDFAWTYKTDIPHAAFDIFEDGEKYCRGIVFDIKELQ